MRVAVVHGYYLHDSGSGVYARQVAHELVRQGHDVTLVCQERNPELYDFIDEVYLLDPQNRELHSVGGRDPVYPGRCRLIRPHLRRLLVYVEGPFPGFERESVKAFHNCPEEWIGEYVFSNVRALETAFQSWRPEAVLANHAMMQPYIVNTALAGSAPFTATVHGSELNFSIKNDPRLVPFTLDGLREAAAVVTVSHPSAQDLLSWASSQGLELEDKIQVVTPGVDVRTFTPPTDRAAALEALAQDVPLLGGVRIRPEQKILACAGRLMWTKGIQHAVSALPLVVARHPGSQLLIAGEGPAQPALERLLEHLSRGEEAEARALAASEPQLQTLPRFGPVVPPDLPRGGSLAVAFLGHLTSSQLGRLFAAADVSLAPSVFPEAVGLVTSEALSAGALPLASYHSGLSTVVDVVADSLADPVFKSMAPGRCLTHELGVLINHALERYPTASTAFRRRLHDLAQAHFPSWRDVSRRYLQLAGLEA